MTYVQAHQLRVAIAVDQCRAWIAKGADGWAIYQEWVSLWMRAWDRWAGDLIKEGRRA